MSTVPPSHHLFRSIQPIREALDSLENCGADDLRDELDTLRMKIAQRAIVTEIAEYKARTAHA